jgi:hypothetical protein
MPASKLRKEATAPSGVLSWTQPLRPRFPPCCIPCLLLACDTACMYVCLLTYLLACLLVSICDIACFLAFVDADIDGAHIVHETPTCPRPSFTPHRNLRTLPSHVFTDLLMQWRVQRTRTLLLQALGATLVFPCTQHGLTWELSCRRYDEYKRPQRRIALALLALTGVAAEKAAFIADSAWLKGCTRALSMLDGLDSPPLPPPSLRVPSPTAGYPPRPHKLQPLHVEVVTGGTNGQVTLTVSAGSGGGGGGGFSTRASPPLPDTTDGFDDGVGAERFEPSPAVVLQMFRKCSIDLEARLKSCTVLAEPVSLRRPLQSVAGNQAGVSVCCCSCCNTYFDNYPCCHDQYRCCCCCCCSYHGCFPNDGYCR